MNQKSYGDCQRERNPLAAERARLVVDLTTELKLALEDRGWAQRDLADKLGTTPSIVSRQLGGRENLTLAKLVDIAFALGKRIEFRLRDIHSSRIERSHLKMVVSTRRELSSRFQFSEIASAAAPTKHLTAA